MPFVMRQAVAYSINIVCKPMRTQFITQPCSVYYHFFNSFRTKRVCYILVRTQSVPRSKHRPLRL